jgi:hypothetical protein
VETFSGKKPPAEMPGDFKSFDLRRKITVKFSSDKKKQKKNASLKLK